MGVDFALFERLVDLSTRFQPKGRTLMLGRQKFGIETRVAKHYEKALRGAEIDERRFAFLQEDGYGETLFEKLGFGQMEAMDFSGYEGASILHDLNKPIPDDLDEQFDFILDGGTLARVQFADRVGECFSDAETGWKVCGYEPLQRLAWARAVPV